MRTVIALLTLVAFSLLAADLVTAQERNGARRRPTYSVEKAAAFLDELTLTDAQKEKIAELKKQYAPRYEQAQKRVEELFAKYTASDPRPLWLSQGLAAQDALKALDAEFHRKLVEVLTPEQEAQMGPAGRQGQSASRPARVRRPGHLTGPVTSEPTEDARAPGSTVIAPPMEVNLENLRWQALPQEIKSAAVSPDQRVWYLMAMPAGAVEMRQSAVRQVVEREFAKPSPQLQGVSCVFFESEGNEGQSRAKLKRVWMLCGERRRPDMLVGYDGKQWMERQSMNVPFERRLRAGPAFLQLNDGVVSFDALGCHVLKGTNWTYHQNLQRSGEEQHVWLDAGGNGLTILAGGEQRKLWRYREGTWSEAAWPKLQFASFSEPPRKLGEFFYVRVGFSLPKLTVPQRASMIRSGLLPPKPAMMRIGLNGEAVELDPQELLAVGRYRIALTCPMYSDPNGTFYAECQEAREGQRKLGPGVVIGDISGKARYVPTSDPPPDLSQLAAIQFFLDGGRRAWTAHALLDMETLTPIDRLPAKQYEAIAATEEGSVFAQCPSRVLGARPEPLMVYRPGVADARKVLSGEKVAIQGGYCIGGDGCIWAARGDFGLERFDGETWRVAAPDLDGKIRVTPAALIPAENGWLLTYVAHRFSDLKIENGMLLTQLFGPQYLLLNGRQCGGGKSFQDWIPQSRSRFLEAFSQPCSNRSWYAVRPEIARQEGGGRVVINRDVRLDGAGVVVDKHKNIWASSLGTVSVVTDKRAADVSVPPDRDKLSAGSRKVTSIALLGDGDFVFLRLADRNSFFARLTPDEDFDFSRGPRLHYYSAVCPLRDHQGGLWLTVEGPKDRQFKDGRLTGVVVRRVTEPDKGQDFNDVGEAELVDASGCVWLAPREGTGGDLVTIWAPSGKTSTLKIPGRAAGSALVAGPEGRVFAWTAYGLQECVAKDSSQPSAYTLGTLYRLEGLDGEPWGGMQYSSLGYLVGLDSGLYLFPLRSGRLKHGAAPAATQAGARDTEPAPERGPDAKPKSASATPELRTWQDVTGKFSIEAALVRAGAGKVTLRKANGTTIEVPLEKLSEADRDYLRHYGR